MKFLRERASDVAIRAIADGEIRIGDTIYDQPVLLTGERVLGTWEPVPVAQLTATHFNDVFDLDPELIVLGTGPTQVFAPRELVFAMARRSIGLEVMDTAAAARTFNVLAGEGRNVVAVLYP